jgi:hypothetical protein
MQEKAHPGQIIIEVEKVEIHPAHARDADKDELFGDIGDGGIETSNLRVKFIAVRSVFTAKDDK